MHENYGLQLLMAEDVDMVINNLKKIGALEN